MYLTISKTKEVCILFVIHFIQVIWNIYIHLDILIINFIYHIRHNLFG
jgi:hypothetical protein